MRYLIKKTEHGILVEKVRASAKVKVAKGWSLVDTLPSSGDLYTEVFGLNEEGEDVSERTFFTAESDGKRLDSIYADAFRRLLSSRKIHEQGIGYPALSKAALAEMDNDHETADELYNAVIKSLAG